MHPITVRTMKFDVPGADDFQPLCIAGNSALSYTRPATSLYAAQIEPFFVKSLRRVMDRFRIGFIEGFESCTTRFALPPDIAALSAHCTRLAQGVR